MHRFSYTLALLARVLPPAAQTSERYLEYGFGQRVRNESWNNPFDFHGGTDDERGRIRYRTRLWLKAPVTSSNNISLGEAQ